jgi:hypothetical protein
MNAAMLAAGLDWLEGLLPALFVGFWILSQVFAIFRRPANRGEQPQPVGRGRQAAPPPRRLPPADVLDDVRGENGDPGELIEMRPGDRARLEREIEEFLAGRRGGRPAANESQDTSSVQRPDRRPRRRGEPRRQRGAVKPPRGADPVATPPPLPAPAVTDVARPPIIDTDIARHVDEAFAHDLAHESPLSLNDKPPTKPSLPKPSQSLAAMLRDPATIRQIVVMREVLERPTERW